ncbi:unnamed protein product, partial [marine sediment metagenome]
MALSAWERVSVSTLNRHVKKLTEPIYRKRILMAMFRKMGRIKYNCSGKKFDWRVQFKLPEATPIAGDMQPRSPQRRSLYRTAELPWRGKEVSEAISKFEKLQNQGDEALFKLVANATENLSKGMVNGFHLDLYNDGNASGTSGEKIHGLNSWHACTDSGARAATAADSYANLDTTLGAYGGSWTGTYPEGHCNDCPEYEAWSPLNVDYTDAAWKADGITWADTGPEALRWAIHHQDKRDYPLDVIILDGSMMIDFKNALTDKERITVSRGAAGSLAIEMGFKAV